MQWLIVTVTSRVYAGDTAYVLNVKFWETRKHSDLMK